MFFLFLKNNIYLCSHYGHNIKHRLINNLTLTKMKKIYFLILSLMLSTGAVQAGLPPEFSVANADGVMISYGKECDFLADCDPTLNGCLVTFKGEGEEKYAGKVEIPDKIVHYVGTTAYTYNVVGIAPWTFENCTELTTVIIPASVYYVDAYAFSNASYLTDIYVAWPDPEAISISDYGAENFEGINADNITLHVPEGTKSNYENNNVWKVFKITDDINVTTDSIARLQNLTVNGGVLLPEFSPTRNDYTVTVPRSVESITLTAKPAYGGTVRDDGEKQLDMGENTFQITVKSADETKENVYTVTVTRIASDIILSLLSAVNQTGIYGFTDPVTGRSIPLEDKRLLTYRLTTGNVSGDIPLHFEADGETADRTVILLPNYTYEMIVRVWIDKTGINLITQVDAFGRPSYSEIIYPNSTTSIVTISNNQGTLNASQTELHGPVEKIEFLSIEDKGSTPVSVIPSGTARPVSYYNLYGQRLVKEPASGLYIIQYDNGTAVKTFKTK
jgi:hypothetical protein